MNKISIVVFEECLTEQGLANLRDKYPSNEVIDMTDDVKFKAARKTRAERNKLVDLINRRRIDTANEIKEDGDGLVDEVNRIYDTVVVPFEVEDKRRKEVKAEKQRLHGEILREQQKQIDGFSAFVTECENGGDSESISSAIDGITNIDCEIFHKDIIHKAFDKKKEVLDRLGSMLTQRIAYESAEGERQKLERQQKIERKLNDLKMIPVNFTGKPSSEISEKIEELKEYKLVEEQFGELYSQAVESLGQVITQLEGIKAGAEALEQVQANKIEQEGDRLVEIDQERREDAETESQSKKTEVVELQTEPEKSAEEIITRFFAGFSEFNPEQAEAITEVIMSDGVPGVTIEVTKGK